MADAIDEVIADPTQQIVMDIPKPEACEASGQHKAPPKKDVQASQKIRSDIVSQSEVARHSLDDECNKYQGEKNALSEVASKTEDPVDASTKNMAALPQQGSVEVLKLSALNEQFVILAVHLTNINQTAIIWHARLAKLVADKSYLHGKLKTLGLTPVNEIRQLQSQHTQVANLLGRLTKSAEEYNYNLKYLVTDRLRLGQRLLEKFSERDSAGQKVKTLKEKKAAVI